ncbi:MAG: hypothetical protein IPM00_02585 [Tetrasphaera sp.]|nr:hypothetical protein [Tetrasphaera sp.]
MAAAEPENTTYRRDVALGLARLADLAVARGDVVVARDLLERSQKLSEALAAAEPENTTYRRDVALGLDRLADLAVDWPTSS